MKIGAKVVKINHINKLNYKIMARYEDYLKHLKVITNGLKEIAFANHKSFSDVNKLLKECYMQVNAEFHTFEEWYLLGYRPKKHEHAYMFWKDQNETEIVFMFTKEQVEIES